MFQRLAAGLLQEGAALYDKVAQCSTNIHKCRSLEWAGLQTQGSHKNSINAVTIVNGRVGRGSLIIS